MYKPLPLANICYFIYLSVHVTLEINLYFLCTDCLMITRTTPHSRSTPWVESKANRYTAYQSPLLTEEPSGFYNLQNIRVSFIILTIENIYLLKLASAIKVFLLYYRSSIGGDLTGRVGQGRVRMGREGSGEDEFEVTNKH